MTDISTWALRNKKLIYFLIVTILVTGVIAYTNMSKFEDPEIKVPRAMVVAVYPGATAEQMEKEVAVPLEKSIRSMKDVSGVVTRCYDDMAYVEVQLNQLVKTDEMEQHWDILRRKVNDAKTTSLPAGVTTIVKDDFGDVYGMFYAMTGDGFTQKEMSDYASEVQRRVRDLEGISDVEIYGAEKESVVIRLQQDKMASLGIHPAEIIQTINGQNATVYAGWYKSDGDRIKVDVTDRYRSPEDIANLILEGHEDDQTRLGDIASVTSEIVPPVRNSLKYDGTPALGICISTLPGNDVTKIGRSVDKCVKQMQEEDLPVGIEFHKVFFQPDKVSSAINTFMWNLVESVLIVILVLMLTMGVRSGFIIGLTLVVTVLGSIGVLYAAHGTLQRVSLGSFILAMGMLVDNAIVIMDGILIDYKRGKPKEEALTSIGRKTAGPLLGATLIAIFAFMPVYLSPDIAGDYCRDLFIVLAISLLLSWILALTQVPIDASRMLKYHKADTGKEPFKGKGYDALRKTLSWGLTHKWLAFGLAVALIAASALCYRFLPQEFFPDMAYNQLYIEYKLPEGTSTEHVSADLDSISSYLKSRGDVQHITTSLGGTPARYNLVRSIAYPSLSYGELIIDLQSPDKAAKEQDNIQQYLTEHYPQAYARVRRYNLMFMPYPVQVCFKGPDAEVLKSLTAQAEDIMKKSDRTQLVCSSWENEVPAITVNYDQAAARGAGFSRTDVGLSLLAATEGIPIGSFYDGSDAEKIYLQCVGPDGKKLSSLETATAFSLTPALTSVLNKETVEGLVTGTTTKEDVIAEVLRTVPVSDLGSVDISWRDPLIIRENGVRMMCAQCDPKHGVSNAAARESVREQIEKIKLPAGYTMEWGGEYAASKFALKYLFKYFPFCIVLMILILILLFKDYRKPLIIACCVPLLFVGVVPAILISGKAFGFVAICGTLGLIGMLIKNGIVLMDEISTQMKSGKDRAHALLDSSTVRFRPVMMASLTTILGVVPLVRDQLFGSLAVTIIGGLFVGTIITLVYLPVLYAIFFGVDTSELKKGVPPMEDLAAPEPSTSDSDISK
jgi:multidrug efflux pump subunit AcrB